MKENELNFILQEGEGLKIEFKESVDKSIAKEIVAFSNSIGGRIFLGVTDNGEVKGINVTNELKSQIMDIANNCDPSIKIKISTLNKILIVEVPEGKNKPYSCSSGFHLRMGASSQKLSRDEILEFSISEGRKTFDEQWNERFYYPDDFDLEKLKEYLKETKLSPKLDTESILINLGVAKKEQRLQFNNAGILFFAKEPARFFLTTKVVCAEYATNEKTNILDRKIFDEGVLKNIQSSINYVTKHIDTRFEIESAKRVEIPQFPEKAYREAIVNSIMHRDYFDKSSEVMIEVFKNKLSIYNPGGLVRWLKPEEFGKISKTRNPVIASLLSRTIYVEKMGTGIKRIKEAIRNAKLPEPQFRFDEHNFFVEIYDDSKELNKIPENKNEAVGETVGETVGKILEAIKTNPRITREGLKKITQLSIRGVEWNLAKLKEKGIIKRVGPKKGGHWEVKL